MLNPEQKAAYLRDGFLAPLEALGEDEVRHYRQCLDAFEEDRGGPLTGNDPALRYKTHVLLPWVAELVRHPRILDAVEALVGPDILCWTCTWFIKEPGSPSVTVWHQDATYFGLRPHEHVTAWIALGEASEASGCMRFVPASHELGQLRHVARAIPNSMNGGGQRTEREFDLEDTVAAPLGPGQFSLHHTLCVHTSGPNTTRERRIGLGISYIPAAVRHIGTARMPASLVRGRDRYGHFDLEPRPGSRPADSAHASIYRRYRQGYNEQIEWHAAGRGWSPDTPGRGPQAAATAGGQPWGR